MGYVVHDALVITVRGATPDHEETQKVMETWKKVFPDFAPLLVGPFASVVNLYSTWLLVPDGSKEGWPTSDDGDRARDSLRLALRDLAVVMSVSGSPDGEEQT